MRLIGLVPKSERVKQVKSSLREARRRREGLGELNGVSDPWVSLQERPDTVWIRLARGWIRSNRLQKLQGLFGRTREEEGRGQRDQVGGCAIGQIETHG